MKLNIKNIKSILADALGKDPKRYEHSINVAKTALILSKSFKDVDKSTVLYAGLLHDIGKQFDRKTLVDYCDKNGIPVTEFERNDNQMALHGKVASHMIKKLFLGDPKNDPEQIEKICSAVTSHVAGSDEDEMSDLDKIIFIADNIEPNREAISELLLPLFEENKVESLNRCMLLLLEYKINKANAKSRAINPLILKTKENLLSSSQEEWSFSILKDIVQENIL